MKVCSLDYAHEVKIKAYCFLMINYDLMSLHIKFHENPINGFRVIEFSSIYKLVKFA